MKLAIRGAASYSRRWFLTSIAAGSCITPSIAAETTGKGRLFPSVIEQYPDPATEFPIFRITDPQFTSSLPSSSCRAIAARGDSLLFTSNMTGRFEAFRLDLKTGSARQLTEAEALNPAAVTFLPGDRTFAYVDGDRLIESNLTTFKSREIYRTSRGSGPAEFTISGGLSVGDDGQYAVVVEVSGVEASPVEKTGAAEDAGKKTARYRLQLIRMLNGTVTTLVESDGEIRDAIPRPRRASALYRRGDSVYLVNFDGHQNRRLRTAEGTTYQALWGPDGRSVMYLTGPVDPHRLHNLREFSPDTNEDRPIADTSQFVSFQRNADASVFVGASGSKASPYVLLLVRLVKRELTVAEHRASDAAMVAPIFSPNSQQIYFVSDRHGKPAIYAVRVDKLVEQTASG